MKQRLFVLFIGNNNFADKGYDLKMPIKDSEDFAMLIRETAKPIYGDVIVRVLLDATEQELIGEMLTMVGEMLPEDAFVLFIASYGYAMNDLYYI